MKLEQNAENRLMEACFPYWLMEQLRAENDAAATPVSPRNFHDHLREQIQRARSRGIQGASDLKIYCSLSIQLGNQFAEHCLLKRVWADTAAGKSLVNALGLLDDKDWKEVKISLAANSGYHSYTP